MDPSFGLWNVDPMIWRRWNFGSFGEISFAKSLKLLIGILDINFEWTK